VEADEAAEPVGPAASWGEWTTPRTPDELHAWIGLELGLRISRTALSPGNSAPFEYIVYSFFEGEQSGGPMPTDCVVWANRGGGKTMLGALATLLDVVFKPGIEVRLLGGSMEQSRRMHAHLTRFLAKPAFDGLIKGRITDKRVRLTNRS
jgi:hypothetical protein